MTATRKIKGFTLIEILIVVIILGILAAIVIPQFSNASTSAKTSALQSTCQTLRSQVALYRLQHNDILPGGGATTTFASGTSANFGTAGTFWGDLTAQTDATGAAYTTAAASGPFGPYMQAIPNNALTGGNNVVVGTAPASGGDFVYDYGTGGNAAHGGGNVRGASDTTYAAFVP